MGWAGLGAVSQPVLGLDADEKGVGISYTLGGINSLATNNESGAVLADPTLAEGESPGLQKVGYLEALVCIRQIVQLSAAGGAPLLMWNAFHKHNWRVLGCSNRGRQTARRSRGSL